MKTLAFASAIFAFAVAVAAPAVQAPAASAVRKETREERMAKLQARIDAAGRAGGGKIVVAAGEHYLEGPIHLRSNIELHLEEGAKVVFADDPKF